jgi:gamma-glutamylcyclotransferase (GGCT)/AIG2-like uncharacterized protein YtfP
MKVAVYGTLKLGHGNHGLLKDSKLLGTDYLYGWDMYDLGAFPGIVPGEAGISVEVYEIDEETLRKLDGLEGYREGKPDKCLYLRKTVDTQFGEAYIYEFARVLRTNYTKVQGVASW